jgi:hypothetical protein
LINLGEATVEGASILGGSFGDGAPSTSRPSPASGSRADEAVAVADTVRPVVDWTSPRIVPTRAMQMLGPK